MPVQPTVFVMKILQYLMLYDWSNDLATAYMCYVTEYAQQNLFLYSRMYVHRVTKEDWFCLKNTRCFLTIRGLVLRSACFVADFRSALHPKH